MQDYEAHLSSYDHSHKVRLRDMKAMTRDSGAIERARKAEAKADGIVRMDVTEQPATGGGFKKAGFKKSGFKSAFGPKEDVKAGEKKDEESVKPQVLSQGPSLAESDTDDEGYEVYDPRHPTD